MISRRILAASLVAASSIMLLASTCKEEVDSRLFAPDAVDPGDTNTPSGMIAAHFQAWNGRDLGTYSGLLGDNFRFYPLPEDAAEILWLNGDSWGREAELGIMGHMFDDGWNGPSTPITAVFFDATTISTVPQSNGDSEVTCNLEGRIETGPQEGFYLSTRLVFDLDYTASRVLEIRSIREVPRTGARGAEDSYADPAASTPEVGSHDARSAGSSLGSIKAVYR